jgi:hypothetical protein
MALRLTIEERDGKTQISLLRSNQQHAEYFGATEPFTSPLAIPDDFEDLRFYLEEYASLPVGEYAVLGERVENERLAAWGEALFQVCFRRRRKAGRLSRRAHRSRGWKSG